MQDVLIVKDLVKTFKLNKKQQKINKNALVVDISGKCGILCMKYTQEKPCRKYLLKVLKIIWKPLPN